MDTRRAMRDMRTAGLFAKHTSLPLVDLQPTSTPRACSIANQHPSGGIGYTTRQQKRIEIQKFFIISILIEKPAKTANPASVPHPAGRTSDGRLLPPVCRGRWFPTCVLTFQGPWPSSRRRQRSQRASHFRPSRSSHGPVRCRWPEPGNRNLRHSSVTS